MPAFTTLKVKNLTTGRIMKVVRPTHQAVALIAQPAAPDDKGNLFIYCHESVPDHGQYNRIRKSC